MSNNLQISPGNFKVIAFAACCVLLVLHFLKT